MLLGLIVISVCAVFLLSRMDKIFRMVKAFRLARKMAGPSLWELATFSGKILPEMSDFGTFVSEQTVKYDFKTWCLWRGLDLVTVISDPDTLSAAFKNKNLNNKEEKLYGGFKFILTRNTIVDLNGPEWKLRRTLVNAAVNKNFLGPHLDVIYEESLRCMDKLKQSVGETDVCIRKELESTLIRIAIRTLLVRDIVLEDDFVEEISFSTCYCERLIALRYVNFVKFLFVSKLDRRNSSRFRRAVAEASEMVRKEKERVSQEMKSGITSASMVLESFIMEALKTNSLSEKDIISESILLMIAAYETTLTAVNAAICMLALHPDIQTRAAEEISQIFGRDDRPIGFHDLSQMEYLERVIKESMRLFPPVPILLRRVDRETDLNGSVVPEGSSVAINIRAVHRNPKVFMDPLKFDPDRFGPGAPERHPYAFLPFSSGLRNCAGRYHAMMTMKTILATLLRNFKVYPGRGMSSVEDVKIQYGITLQMGENLLRLAPIRDLD